jgi:hypothetical protein
MSDDPGSPSAAAATASAREPASLVSYRNFRDPVGLVWRMLRSRDRAARAALRYAFAELALGPLDRLLGLAESRRLCRAAGPMLPPFLIVGGSRAGTTMIYQTLARCLPFSYLNNLSALFPHSVIEVTARWRGSFDPPRVDARSYFGQTAGLSGVNDGLHVWNRWLGDDRYSTPRQIDPATAAEMRRFFVAWSQAFGRPFLNKCNRNLMCVEALAAALPNAVIIAVRRDPLFVAQSLLKARREIQGDEAVGWGVGASRSQRSAASDPVADVAEQVRFCDETLDAQVATLPAERVIELTYEEFCRDPVRDVKRVWERMQAACPPELALPAPHLDGLRPFRGTERLTLDDAQLARLRELLGVPRRAMDRAT